MNFNQNTPLTQVYIIPKYLGLSSTEPIPGYWYGITSIPGRMLGCHVMLENGANWARLPLHALLHENIAINIDPQEIQKWDCFSYDIQVIRFNFLRDQPVQLLDDPDIKGRYLFTIDSADIQGAAPFSEFVEQHKTFTVIACDDGTIRTRPNNMLRWLDQALYDTKEPLPAFTAQTQVFRAENKI